MEPINANAQYIVVVVSRGIKMLIDMNDIAQIQFGQEVSVDDFNDMYKIAIITWKEPYADQWQALIDSNGQKMWEKFNSKVAKTVDKTENV